MADSPVQEETTAGHPHLPPATQTLSAQDKDPPSPALKFEYKQSTGPRTLNSYTQYPFPVDGNDSSFYSYDDTEINDWWRSWADRDSGVANTTDTGPDNVVPNRMPPFEPTFCFPDDPTLNPSPLLTSVLKFEQAVQELGDIDFISLPNKKSIKRRIKFYPCDKCCYTSYTLIELERHIRRSHNKLIFKCDCCGRMCSRPDNLQIHKKRCKLRPGPTTQGLFETQGKEIPLGRPMSPPRKASELHKFQIRDKIPAPYIPWPTPPTPPTPDGFLPSSNNVLYAGASEVADSGYASIEKCDSPTARTKIPNFDGNLDIREPPVTLSSSNTVDFEDTETVYSGASSMRLLTKEHYISELADTLFQEVYADHLNSETLDNTSEALPELLKAFALKIGYNAPSQMHRDIMFFIHKNRGDIANSFKESRARKNTHLLLDAGFTTHDVMPLPQRIDLWRASAEFLPIPTEDSYGDEKEIYSPEEVEYEDEDANIDQASLAYRDFISKSPAYRWLTEMIQNLLHLIPGDHNYMDDIKKKIIAFLPSSRRISKAKSSEAFKVIFMTGFKPFEFIKEQEYGSDLEPGDAIMKSITLTGSLNDAQALPCAQYLIQTWPSTGEDIVELIKKVLRDPTSTHHKCTLWDKAELAISIQGSELIAEVLGPSPSIVEIGQQMAWLSAAFQPSLRETNVSICVPSIQDIHIINDHEHEFDPLIPRPPSILCKFGFLIQEHDEATTLSCGQCWHRLFRNPVAVIGYPIPRRPSAGTGCGLEIPLNMMAALAGTNYIQLFNKKLYIKRFSTMIVPTKRKGDILVWHLLYKPDGGHISYLDSADTGHLDDLDISEIETSRHVLGWCLDARYYAGAPDANYEAIRESGLPRPHGDNFVLGEVHIQGGRIIKGGFPVILGKRDLSPHIPREDFGGRLQWIDEKPFVLWDEEDKRGWLVNGSSVLLHLLRKSLDSSGTRTNKFRFKFCFKKELMQEALVTHTPASAVQVLWNEDNLRLELYPKSEGYFCVKDRVDQLLNVLEQIIEHQIRIGKQELGNGSNRGHLEGWDFNDLATSEDPYYPRFATFAKPSGGWIEFSRVINAAILFGRRFGEMIRAGNIGCSKWATVPTGEYYLAAAVDDLKEIIKKNAGDQLASPMRLTNDIIWHTPSAIFKKCKCRKKKHEGKHSNFIQVALPAQQSNQVKRGKTFRLENGSAVIFGQNHKTQELLFEGEQLLGYETPSAFGEHDAGSNGTRSNDSGVGLSQTPSLQLNPKPPLNFNRSDYRVGIICALPKEFFAVRALFDDEHGDQCLRSLCIEGDTYVNNYALGCLSGHKVVAVCFSSGSYGLSAASNAYTNLSRSFQKLEFCLMVGIGGGVPSKNIRLGDVVVSHPTVNDPGVIQYDFGQEVGDEFIIKRTLERPPEFILGAISKLRSNPNKLTQPLQAYLKIIEGKNQEYGHPGRETDPLFTISCSGYGNNTHQCETTQNLPHIEDEPRIHYGLIGSANRVMKNAETRDRWGKEHNVLCFEMEGAAIMDGRNRKGLVIRGISDYSDSTKNDVWQNYAAATAAAYAKFLLSNTMIPGIESPQMAPVETQPMKRAGGLTPEYSPAESTDPPRKRRRKKYTL